MFYLKGQPFGAIRQNWLLTLLPLLVIQTINLTRSMNVKDIFELRKQGKIEEAYEAIRAMYAVHKGRYTSLCMFWTASDVFKKRLEEKRIEEAEKIYLALKRLVPSIEDNKTTGFMHYAEGRLIKESEHFRRRYFAIKSKNKAKKQATKATEGTSKEFEGSSDASACRPEGTCKAPEVVDENPCLDEKPWASVPAISS